MNILYICPRFPYPPREGDKVVIYNHIKFLSERHNITLLTLINSEKELAGLANLSKYCKKVETFNKRQDFSFWNFLAVALKTAPFTVIRYRSREMFRRSKELIETGDFDIVHVSQYYMGQYAIDKSILVPQKTAVVLDVHTIEYFIYAGYASRVKNPVLKLLVWLEALRVKEYEARIFGKADRCLVVSEADDIAIKRFSGKANAAVNPFCMDLYGAAEAHTVEAEKGNAVLFFGTLKTFPNRDGLRYFYKEVFPIIKREVPGTKLIVAGEMPRGLDSGLASDPDVELAGFIPDIRTFLKKAAVVVVPLRIIGGGLTIKILESWAAAMPVVSTSKAAVGIKISDGVDIAIADSAQEFAARVADLLRDKQKREAMGQAAFAKIKEYYSPDMVIANLEKIYKEALARDN